MAFQIKYNFGPLIENGEGGVIHIHAGDGVELKERVDRMVQACSVSEADYEEVLRSSAGAGQKERREEIFRRIEELVDRTDDPQLLAGRWQVADVRELFRQLLFTDYADSAFAGEQEQLWQDLESTPTQFMEGELCLNRFLHVMGYLMKLGIYSNKATRMVALLFPGRSEDERATLRVYLQKGKKEALSLQLEKMLRQLHLQYFA